MSTRVSYRVTQSASLGSSRRSQGRTSREPDGGATLIGTGIAFVASSTITDSNNGFVALSVGQRIRVRGSPLNSREWRIAGKPNDGQIAVRPQMVQEEAAGASITIELVD